MRRILFIICIVVLECALAFKAKLEDLSEPGEIKVTCKAVLGAFEKFKGPLTLTIVIQEAASAEVSKATWQPSSSYSLSGLQYKPTVQSGDVCDDVSFCISYKQPAPFSSAGTFICKVNDNGNVEEDSNFVSTEGTYGIILIIFFSLRYPPTHRLCFPN